MDFFMRDHLKSDLHSVSILIPAISKGPFLQGWRPISIFLILLSWDSLRDSFIETFTTGSLNVDLITSKSGKENNSSRHLGISPNRDTENPLSKYTLYSNKKCKDTSNTLVHNSPTIKKCAENCTNNPKCISFDYNKNNKTCRLTTDCYNENSSNSTSHNLYQKKDIIIHPYVEVRDVPCQKEFNIVYHKFYNDFCVDSEGNKAKLKYCACATNLQKYL